MKYLTLVSIFFYLISCNAQNKDVMNTIYDYKVEDIYGEEFDFSTLKGKKFSS